jgi:hypothetical protein
VTFILCCTPEIAEEDSEMERDDEREMGLNFVHFKLGVTHFEKIGQREMKERWV